MKISGIYLPSLLAIEAMTAIGAAIAILVCIGAAIAMAIMLGKSADAIARQPESADKIRMNLLVGLAFAETTALFGLVVAIMLIIS